MERDTSPSTSSSNTNRGILNAGTQSNSEKSNERFLRERADETMQADLLNRKNQKIANSNSKNSDGESSSYSRIQNAPARQASQRDIEEMFRENGVAFDNEDMSELSGMREENIPKPHFPYFIFTIAVTKDIVDVIATLTVVGIVLSMALSFLCALILFLWTFSKLGGTGRAQKKMTEKILLKFSLAQGIEFIPGVNVIPTNAIFVLVTYFDEAKIGKLYAAAHKKLAIMRA